MTTTSPHKLSFMEATGLLLGLGAAFVPGTLSAEEVKNNLSPPTIERPASAMNKAANDDGFKPIEVAANIPGLQKTSHTHTRPEGSRGQAVKPLNALEELQAAFPAEQRDGYKYIKMDHVRPDGSAAMDVTNMKLSLRKANDPEHDPLVFVNFSHDGLGAKSDSEKQKDFLNRFVPFFAGKNPRQEIVFIDAVAIKKDAEGKPEAVYLANLIAEMKTNAMGVDEADIPFGPGEYIVPYFYVSYKGEKIVGSSNLAFKDTVSDREMQLAMGQRVLTSFQNHVKEPIPVSSTTSNLDTVAMK